MSVDLSTTPLGLAFLAGLILGAILGVVLALVWLEARHDCMPHEADRCRIRADVPTWRERQP